MTVSPDDDVLLLLAHRYRRRVVETLSGRPEAPLDACIPDEEPTSDVRAAYERQLEELARAGVVEYDESTHTVSRGAEFDRVRPVVEAVAEAGDRNAALRNDGALRRVQRTFEHDVRNTLQVLRTHVAALDERPGDPDENHVEAIERGIEKVARQVELAGKLTAAIADEGGGRREMALGPALRGTVRDVADAHENVRFEVDDVPDASVRADARLPLVFENVVRNAAEHGSAGRQNARRSDDAVEHGTTDQRTASDDADALTVRVTATREEDRVRVTIEDDGPGFPTEDPHALLGGEGTAGANAAGEDEDTAGVDTAGEDEGTAGANAAGGDEGTAGVDDPHGLGLYFVQETVEAYGGDLTLENRSPTGARVRIDLPCASRP